MTSLKLIHRSLWHFWRTNAALMAGVMVATAVIGGALLIGDSVRYSLRQMTLNRLGKIDAVVTGHRFFREELANSAAPALVFVGSLEHPLNSAEVGPRRSRRAGQVQVYGIDDRAWALIDHGALAPPDKRNVILGSRTAQALSAAAGESVTLWLELPSTVPRDTLLGQRDNETAELTLTVSAIAPETSQLSRLSLHASQQLPLTAFVNLRTLQDRLDLSAIKPTARDPDGRPARVNTLLSSLASPESAEITGLNQQLKQSWKPTDLGLRIAYDQQARTLVIDSTQMVLEDRLAEAIQKTASELQLASEPVHVYLANWLKNAQDESAFSMYSVVAGLDVLSHPETWEFQGPRPKMLGEWDIILNEWLASDLKVQPGDQIRLGYHLVGSHGELPEAETVFTVAGVVKLAGPAADRTLTPQVKGITDADTFGDWQQPFPMKLDLVTKRDDAYWARYRATPKAFVSLRTSQELWRSRYGKLSSLRLAVNHDDGEELRAKFESRLMQIIDPAPLGLTYQPVKAQGLAAASGSQDFTGLFVGFSFFLILAATILIGLLLRLGVEQRVKHWGLLGALGFTPAQIRRLLLTEGMLLAVLGGVLGLPAAIGYAQLMIVGLTTWWIGAIGTTELRLSITLTSLLTGFLIACLAAFAAIWWGLRQVRQASTRDQLMGLLEPAMSSVQRTRRRGRAYLKAFLALMTAGLLIVASLAGWIPSAEAFSGLGWPVVTFFLAGLLLLSGSMWCLSARLQAERGMAVRGHGTAALTRLGWRNASRQQTRSVLTAGLIASASFVIAAVAAGQVNPVRLQPEKFSGNGGFTLVAESSRPILYDLNTRSGRTQLGITMDADSPEAALWARMKILQFRVNPGEDASCLNLFQTRVPTILGTPPEMITRGGFTFANAGGNDPWRLLSDHPGADPVPVLGDMNTLMFSLKKGVGAQIPVPDPERAEHQLQVAGMFNGAVFQGVLLMSDEQFQRLYPERKGYQYFLAEVPVDDADAAIDLLESSLAPYGLDAERVSERLARFLSVQNTYLSTFQSLGGLGLLLGTLGLATVMLRNVWERQAELALFRAIGFSTGSIGQLILWETAFLLTWGLCSGIVSALVAMLPHLRSTGANVPWNSVAGLFLAVFAAGLLAAVLAIRSAVRVPIVTTLRGE